jgi:DNA-binding transcriptional LysR family regulator
MERLFNKRRRNLRIKRIGVDSARLVLVRASARNEYLDQARNVFIRSSPGRNAESECRLPSHEDIPNHTSTNDTAGALAAAVGGLGIASTTSWACRMEIESGALVSVLPDWKMAELPVHAYFPMGRTTRMAARAFVDFLSTVLASDPQHFGPLK